MLRGPPNFLSGPRTGKVWEPLHYRHMFTLVFMQLKLYFNVCAFIFFLNFYIKFTNETLKNIILFIYLAMKAIILDTHGKS